MKVFKNLSKTIKESISSNFADLFYLKSTKRTLGHSNTAWKVSKYWVFSGPYFPAFGLNTESECRKIRTRKNSVFGHISPSERALKQHLTTPRTLQGHARCFWAVKALGHASTWGASKLEENLSIQALKALGHLKSIWVLRHSGTWALGHSRYLRHFI